MQKEPQQEPLFQELDELSKLKAAVRADVEAAGGFKVVAAVLWPNSNPVTAQQKLSNACNPKQKQELDYHDTQKVKLLARRAIGASRIHEYESTPLDCSCHWITREEKIDRHAVKLADVARVVQRIFQETQELMKEVQEIK